jgi:hypothetical protein
VALSRYSTCRDAFTIEPIKQSTEQGLIRKEEDILFPLFWHAQCLNIAIESIKCADRGVSERPDSAFVSTRFHAREQRLGESKNKLPVTG